MTHPITRTDLEQALAPVEGWLALDEAWALHEAAYAVGRDRDDPVVVEIGSWKGRSTVALASGLAAAGRGTVHAVDPHAGTRTNAITGVSDTWPEFSANLHRAGLSAMVEPVRCSSHAARPRFQPRSVHALFVDASHRYEDVVRDIDDWSSALADGATVAFHDVVWSNGVRRALRKRVVSSGAPFREPRLVQNTLLARYDPSSACADDRAAWLRMRLRLWEVGLYRDGTRALRPLRPHLPASVELWGRRLIERVSGGAIGSSERLSRPANRGKLAQ